MDRPVIVCLCGSTRFAETYRQANLTETLAGKIVLSIGIDTKSDQDLLLAGEITVEDKERLDALHLRKIELADEVLFLNVNGYMGRSTLIEHFYASNIGKEIRYWQAPAYPNEYYVRASTVGVEWLEQQRKQRNFRYGLHLIDRRTWFSDDTPSGVSVGWVDIGR